MSQSNQPNRLTYDELFLPPHQWGTLPIFDLAFQLPTIAIRDQLIRAQMLAERLPRWLRIRYRAAQNQKLKVLVIGGGICGLATAFAMAASDQNLRITVVDQTKEPFSVQRNCQTRWIDPTQYDWPRTNWDVCQYPWSDGETLPHFTFRADKIADICRRSWDTQLLVLQQNYQNVNFFMYTDADLDTIEPESDRYGNDIYKIKLTDNDTKQSRFETFAAIVIAIDFGRETCQLPGNNDFRGLRFWDTDPFLQEYCGCESAEKEGTVLISGTGDGGLQDFLRIVTKQESARHIYDYLNLSKASFDFQEILSAEIQLERARSWGHPERYREKLHRLYETCADRVLSEYLLNDNDSIKQLQTLLARSPANTYLIGTSRIFSCYYSLNRFLVLLLLRAFEHPEIAQGKFACFYPDRRVDQITPIGSLPFCDDEATRAMICIGLPWRVRLCDAHNGMELETITANIIVLRHGNTPPTSPGQYLSNWLGPRPLLVDYLH